MADPGIPDGDANPQGEGTNLLFGQFFPKNCIKMKETGHEGRIPDAPLDPPIGMASFAGRNTTITVKTFEQLITNPMWTVSGRFTKRRSQLIYPSYKLVPRNAIRLHSSGLPYGDVICTRAIMKIPPKAIK